MLYAQHLTIEEASQPGEARRLVTSLCHNLNFSDLHSNQAALIVTELATNLVKHSHAGGELIFTPVEEAGLNSLEILSLDKGVGISNISECLKDGYSTTGTPGGGLGAVIRLSHVFDIFSQLNQGTAIYSKIWQNSPPMVSNKLSIAAVCLPLTGETACGDALSIKQTLESDLILLVDCLCHGEDAAVASNLAVSIFLQHTAKNLTELFLLLHESLRHTRGAALAIAEVVHTQGLLRFIGVGNISASILTETSHHNLVSHNGTAGINTPHFSVFSYPWTNDSLLVMHTDGIATHWSFDDYAGLKQKQAALIAGILYRDYQRLKDDSTVVIVKPNSGN